ncbi:MAG: hypothetical protein GEU74_03040 [Nitriliruptorales bacterium]|nr:hypothetical protein [Nitriliruptorales bacterium]
MAEDSVPTKWYWCLRHNRAESVDRCGADLLMGPYESREAAERYAETAKAREDAWEAEDERWEGA